MLAHAITPILNVSDIAASLAWFRKLGWEEAWTYGDPPTFGGVCSGRCEIFLCKDDQGGRGEGGVWMSIWVDYVDAIHVSATA